MTYETVIIKESKESVAMVNIVEVYRFVTAKYKQREQQQIIIMTLGELYHLKNSYLIHLGNVKGKALDIKDICYKIIKDNARYIIVCYIRPLSSDSLMPTEDDMSNAATIFKAAKLINTHVAYQIIISDIGFTDIKTDFNDGKDMVP
jgi:DNA repair protein RadC